MQMSGYKRMKCSASSLENKELSKRLVDALDNELQHHKMFKDFKKMGFPNNSFYYDGDSETKKYLEKILNEKGNSFHDLITDYLTAIAPGGSFTPKEISSLKERFKNKTGDSNPFEIIDDSISDWIDSEDYCQQEVVRNIYRLMEQPTKTWIGFDNGKGFPESGFFIDNEFPIEELS